MLSMPVASPAKPPLVTTAVLCTFPGVRRHYEITEKNVSEFFKGRKVVEAKDLKGPRVYSTDLLPSLFDRSHAKDSILVTARALKIKIITKGLVTLNSTYLLSPLAIHLLDTHPDVFDGPAILPAFRIDRDSLDDLVPSVIQELEADGIDKNRLREHIARIGEQVKHVLPWDLGNVGEQYKALVVAGLRNPATAIARALVKKAGITTAEVEKIAHDIEGLDFRDSAYLRAYIATKPQPARELLDRFTTACYHMNGTGVVKCETGTDLNPLSEFKSADMVLAARDAEPELLSDESIFLEAFMGFALDTVQAAALPAQIIDALDFKTAHALSGKLRYSGFQDKYDEIVRHYLTSSGLEDAREALDTLDGGAIADVAQALAKEYQQAILDELPNYKTHIQSDAEDEVFRAGADIAHDAFAAIPILGDIVSYADIGKTALDGGRAAVELLGVREQSKAFAKARQRRTEEIEKAIADLKIDDKKRTSLLDAVALLSDVHGISIARA